MVYSSGNGISQSSALRPLQKKLKAIGLATIFSVTVALSSVVFPPTTKKAEAKYIVGVLTILTAKIIWELLSPEEALAADSLSVPVSGNSVSFSDTTFRVCGDGSKLQEGFFRQRNRFLVEQAYSSVTTEDNVTAYCAVKRFSGTFASQKIQEEIARGYKQIGSSVEAKGATRETLELINRNGQIVTLVLIYADNDIWWLESASSSKALNAKVIQTIGANFQ